MEPEPDQEEWIPFAVGHVQCPECPEMIPVQVLARVEPDDVGDQVMQTRADLAEVWTHAWVHDQEREHGSHQVGPGQGSP